MGADAGYIETQATIDVTGTTAVSLGIAVCPMDIFEVGVVIVTATGADTLVVDFRKETTPTGSVPANTTNFAKVTGPAATIIAAGKVLSKKDVNTRVKKGDKIWAVASDAATGATDAIAYFKAYPAGEAKVEADDLASTT
jgi:hypothetical protein